MFERQLHFSLSTLSVRWNKIPSQEALGNFELLIDEELAAQDENSGTTKGKSSNRWK